MHEFHEGQTFTYELVSTKREKAFVRAVRLTAALTVVGAVSVWAGFETARRTLAVSHPGTASVAAVAARPVAAMQTPSASKGPMGAAPNEGNHAKAEVDPAELSRLPLQQRAERLLETAMQGDQRSLDTLRENADGWRGHLKSSDRLFDLVLAALNSSDLRVRTAAIDVDLAANNLGKTSQSIDRLVREMENDPSSLGMCLWRLGALGNRGVEPKKVLTHLLLYAHSRNEHTRYWAVEGLGMLGNDATIDPLLTVMAHDTSSRIQELAASSLAHAGMLTREERLGAVPALLNFTDDDSLSAATRELVYGTLRVITGAELGNDAAAWREWWTSHDPAHQKPRGRTGVLRT